MKCKNCGTENKEGTKFCKQCGSPMNPQNDQTPDLFEYPTPKTKSSKWVIIVVIIAAIILAAAVVGGIFLIKNVGMGDEEKMGLPSNGEGMQHDIYDPFVMGEIPTQDHGKDETSSQEDTSSESSSSEAEIKAPNVVGKDIVDACNILNDLGITYNISYSYSDSVPKDKVISQYPTANSTIDSNHKVMLYVSEGSKKGSVTDSGNSNSGSSNSTNYVSLISGYPPSGTKNLPTFSNVKASSTLHPEGIYQYNVSNIMYLDDTCWAEGSPEDRGIGEWVEFSDSKIQSVQGMCIINGYAIDDARFYDNNRVKKMRFEFSDGTSITRELLDTKQMQKVSFGKTIKTKSIKMIIVSEYDGDDIDDTCITFAGPY